MKKTVTFLCFLILFLHTGFGQAPQLLRWPLPGNQVDFTAPATPVVSPLPQSPLFDLGFQGYQGQAALNTHNIMHDEKGDLLFFIIDQYVYDKNGDILALFYETASGQDYVANGASEHVVVPVPGDPNKYYLVGGYAPPLSSFDPARAIYMTLDITQPFILNYFSPNGAELNTGVYQGFHGKDINFAITPLRPDNTRLLFVHNDLGIWRFLVSSSGITDDGYIDPNDFGVCCMSVRRTEMEIVQLPGGTYRLAIPYFDSFFTNNYFVNVFELDAAGAVTAVQSVDIGDANDVEPPKGLELSPDGNYAYFTGNQPPYLYYIDLAAATPAALPLQDACCGGSIANAADFMDTHTEVAHDCHLYYAASNRLAYLTDPNDPTSAWVDNAIVTNVPFSWGFDQTGGVTGGNVRILPDQVDGENYTTHRPAGPYCCLPDPAGSGHFTNLDITVPTTWTTSTFSGATVRIDGLLSIKPGASLAIEPGVTVEFGEAGKVHVEEAATLTLNACTLGGIGDCNNMWQGVEVWGLCSSKGKIVMKNGAVIRDAHNGVLMGKTCFTCPAAPYDGFSGFGTIEARDSYFINNAVGVKFAYTWCACSIIDNCQFQGGTLLDDRYNSSITPPAQQYPDAASPHYAPSNPAGRSAYGIFALKGNYHSVHNCSFDNMVTGVEARDSWFSLDDHDGTGHFFSNMEFGVRLFYTPGQGGMPMYVQYNLFEDVRQSITIANSLFDRIRENTVLNQGQSQGFTIGLFLSNCEGYQVWDNEFTQQLYGIIADNTGIRGGEIREFDQGGNVFTNCWRGVQAQMDNSRLEIRCNNFSPDPLTSPYDNNWMILDQLADQGMFHATDDRAPAGNDFNNFNFQEIYSNIDCFTYYRHSAIPPSPVIPDPIGGCPPVVFNNGVPKTANSCGPPPVAKGVTIAALALKIEALNNDLDAVKSSLDGGGQTALLMSAVGNEQLANGQLKNMLVANSPLSDAVLTAFVQRPGVPPGHFKEVMIPNSPVSKAVRLGLDSKLAVLPPGIAAQVSAVQVVNPDYRTLTAIEREIEALTLQRTLLLNATVTELIQSEQDIEQAIALLLPEGTLESKTALAALFLAKATRDRGSDDYCGGPPPKDALDSALDVLNSATATTPEAAAERELIAMSIGLAKQDKTLFGMTAAQESDVRDKCSQYQRSKAWAGTHCILQMVKGEPYPFIIDDATASGKRDIVQAAKPVQEAVKGEYFGNFVPNPFGESTVLPYHLPEEKKGIVYLYDATGKLIKTYQLHEGSGLLQISSHELNEGVYLCRIVAEGEIIEHKRLVVIK